MQDWEIHRLRGLTAELLGEVLGYVQLVNQTQEQHARTAACGLLAACEVDVKRFEDNRVLALRDATYRNARPR